MVEFKTISYDVIQVGEEFKSDDFLIKPEDVETFAYAVDDHNPWYFEDSPFGGPIAHPVMQDPVRVPRTAARRHARAQLRQSPRQV